MVPPARIERAASSLTKNALCRLSYGGDGAREGGRLPGLRVTRAALYAELCEQLVPAERIELPIWLYKNSHSRCSRQKFTNGRD